MSRLERAIAAAIAWRIAVWKSAVSWLPVQERAAATGGGAGVGAGGALGGAAGPGAGVAGLELELARGFHGLGARSTSERWIAPPGRYP